MGLCLAAGATVAQAALPPAEAQALSDLFNASGGPAWTSIADWATARDAAPTPVCSAPGGSILCNAAGTHVIGIDLYNNHLVGTLPATLGNLAQLQTVQIGYNQLGGALPALSGFSQLKAFDAYANLLNGPIPSFAGLAHLVEFNVAGNQLDGVLPALNGLPALQAINVGFNRLGGPLPVLSGSELPLLNYLEVDNNHFNGAIPDLTGMTALTAFYAGHNRFTGRAPSPPSPNILVANASTLCPNFLAASASSVWDAATQATPWYGDCDTDTIFLDGLEAL